MQAPSTLALSAYNTLARTGARTLGDLFRELEAVDALQGSTPQDLLESLTEMKVRGWVERGDDGGWDVRDAKRRLVRSRNYDDAGLVNGKAIGGWKGWLVQCPRRGMMTLDEAIAEGAGR